MNLSPNKPNELWSKVPEVTLFFWIIKILCTTVGETFADFLNFNLGFGLLPTTILLGIVFFIALAVQFKATRYVPVIYWITVVLISVFGTLVTDNLTDAMGIPLETSTIVFSVLLGLTFLAWFLSEKTLSIHSIYTRTREIYYWLTILFTFALGTAVGDLYSEQLGLGYLHTGLTVVMIIAVLFLAWRFFKLDGVLSFWIVYILTRPLGASIGDYLSQPKNNGGLGLGTTVTSILFLIAISAIIILLAVTKIDVTGTNETPAFIPKAKRNNTALVQTILTLCLFLVVGIGGYMGLNQQISSQNGAGNDHLTGQLTEFLRIENNMLSQINANDFASAKKGADDLEHKWDTDEPKFRKIDGKSWTKIDRTIDVVLAATRSGSPDASKCQSALDSSIQALNEANGY
ncbi:hypothetical protein [Paenibacillus sp. HB172176]|uniref:COG4705 family protein n=1 Tax=Paenibacillus sp. HB172176 TaxID=2493690 RepID=UPI00143ACAD5|nr:hypothetical protein [Paenibacillus sp. HB172176]